MPKNVVGGFVMSNVSCDDEGADDGLGLGALMKFQRGGGDAKWPSGDYTWRL